MGHTPHNPSPFDEEVGDSSQGWFETWFIGLALPAVLAAYGGRGIVTQSIVMSGEHMSITLNGVNAVGLGIAWTCGGLFLHFHLFWRTIFNQVWPQQLGEILSAVGFIGGLGFVLVHNGVFGLG